MRLLCCRILIWIWLFDLFLFAAVGTAGQRCTTCRRLVKDDFNIKYNDMLYLLYLVNS